MRDQFFTDLYNTRSRNWKTDTRRQTSTEQFVRQNPSSLGIILKFHNVIGLVASASFGLASHQMRLCSATHPANLLNDNGHGVLCYRPKVVRSKEKIPIYELRIKHTGLILAGTESKVVRGFLREWRAIWRSEMFQNDARRTVMRENTEPFARIFCWGTDASAACAYRFSPWRPS